MYGKYFASTFTGSMVGAGLNVFAVWGYVIANCRDGSVELNPKLLAMILGCSEAEVLNAIEYLCSPDPQSRTKEHEGRRLLKNGAFLYDVPNHHSYRSILNEDERRQYFREKKREQRARDSKSKPESKTVKDMSTVSTQSEEDAKADSRTIRNLLKPEMNVGKPTSVNKSDPELVVKMENIYKAYPRLKSVEHKGRAFDSTSMVVRDLLKESRFSCEADALDFLLQRVQAFAYECEADGRDEQYIPLMSSWMKGGQYDNEPNA